MHTIETQKVLPFKDADGMYVFRIPCKIGDTAWGLCKRCGATRAVPGKISEIFFIGSAMQVCIVVSHVVRGTWGVNVFATEKEAQEAIKRLNHEN